MGTRGSLLHGDFAMFQQYNARQHTTAVTKIILTVTVCDIDVLNWSAESSDISPIQHFCDNLVKCVHKRNLRNINELRQDLVEEYAAIPQENITALCNRCESESMFFG